MKNVYETNYLKINVALATQNPIEIPKRRVIEEYKTYIYHIFNKIESEESLEKISINDLEIDYDSTNKEQKVQLL